VCAALAGFVPTAPEPAAAAFPRGPEHSALVALSSTRAGVRPVTLSLELGYEMQCGYPGPGPLRIQLPPQVRLPATLPRSALLVDGRAASSAALSGHTLELGLALPPRVMCDVIGPGRLTIVLGRAADVGNPLRAGTYTLAAAVAGSSFSARFTIRPS